MMLEQSVSYTGVRVQLTVVLWRQRQDEHAAEHRAELPAEPGLSTHGLPEEARRCRQPQSYRQAQLHAGKLPAPSLPVPPLFSPSPIVSRPLTARGRVRPRRAGGAGEERAGGTLVLLTAAAGKLAARHDPVLSSMMQRWGQHCSCCLALTRETNPRVKPRCLTQLVRGTPEAF